MSIWDDVDRFVRQHGDQLHELRELAKEGGVFRRPRFRPPCVWVLLAGARAPKSIALKQVFTTYADAKAALEPHALRKRAEREAKAKDRAAKRKAR